MVFSPIWGKKNGGVLSMRMQVILDSSFARPGSALIWGGKKGEFRDWTRCSGGSVSLFPLWHGFDSRTRRHIHVGWVCCLFSSLLRGLFSEFSGFPSPAKTNTPDTNSICPFDPLVMLKMHFTSINVFKYYYLINLYRATKLLSMEQGEDAEHVTVRFQYQKTLIKVFKSIYLL